MQAGFPEGNLFVDTVEKMQGQEAETVIGKFNQKFTLSDE